MPSRKNSIIIFASCIAILIAACTKTTNSTTTNNNNIGPSKPSFVVTGISDITITNNSAYGSFANINLSVEYQDSAQQNISLSISSLPAGITLDTTWTKSGIPTYTTRLSFFDTTSIGAIPGIYPLTVTAQTASGSIYTYPFNLRVAPLATTFLGKYDSCKLCYNGVVYVDSVYLDPAIPNKIWFANFANKGTPVYGIFSWPSALKIPTQLVGTDTISGSNNMFDPTERNIIIPGMRINGTTSCPLDMYNH